MDYTSINRTLINEFVEESLIKYNFSGKVLDVGGERVNTKSKFGNFSYLNLDMKIDLLNYSDKVGADIVHDLNKPMSIDDNSYDHIVSTNALYYVDNFELAFCEISRVLKKDGLFLLTLPMMTPVDEDRYRFCKTKVNELLNKNSFKTIEIKSNGFLPAIIYDSLHILIRDSGWFVRKLFRFFVLLKPLFMFLNRRYFFKSNRVVGNYLIIAKKIF